MTWRTKRKWSKNCFKQSLRTSWKNTKKTWRNKSKKDLNHSKFRENPKVTWSWQKKSINWKKPRSKQIARKESMRTQRNTRSRRTKKLLLNKPTLQDKVQPFKEWKTSVPKIFSDCLNKIRISILILITWTNWLLRNKHISHFRTKSCQSTNNMPCQLSKTLWSNFWNREWYGKRVMVCLTNGRRDSWCWRIVGFCISKKDMINPRNSNFWTILSSKSLHQNNVRSTVNWTSSTWNSTKNTSRRINISQ